jgi:hypothetical protein
MILVMTDHPCLMVECHNYWHLMIDLYATSRYFLEDMQASRY